MISGFLSLVVGDPPPGSGGSTVIQFTLFDGQGRQWSLVFDDNYKWPSGGPRAFDRQQVVVEGADIGGNKIMVANIKIE